MILSFVMVLSLVNFSYGVAGGDFASRGEFPHAVQLSSVPTGKFFCGGNIIHPSVILTAAHCLEENSTRRAAHAIQVTAGSVRKGTTIEEDGVQLCSVDHYIVHPAYKTWDNHDIALLFLTKPLNFSETVAPIQLPSNSSETYSTGVFSGWGDTGWYFYPTPPRSYLKKINVILSKRQTCDQKLSSYSSSRVADNQFCTIFSSGSGICYGDSGGSGVWSNRKCFNASALWNWFVGTNNLWIVYYCDSLYRRFQIFGLDSRHNRNGIWSDLERV